MFPNRFLNITFSTVVVALVILNLGCVETARHEGMSMTPALENGDKMLLTTDFGSLNRGDIVLFKYPKDERKTYVKRIVGLPNETIEIWDGNVSINGKEIEEPYLDQIYNQHSKEFKKKIPANEYFVMGDNRDNSSDSRSWGTVKKELVLGKYWITYSKVTE